MSGSKLQKYLYKLQSINHNQNHPKYNIYMTKYEHYVMEGGTKGVSKCPTYMGRGRCKFHFMNCAWYDGKCHEKGDLCSVNYDEKKGPQTCGKECKMVNYYEGEKDQPAIEAKGCFPLYANLNDTYNESFRIGNGRYDQVKVFPKDVYFSEYPNLILDDLLNDNELDDLESSLVNIDTNSINRQFLEIDNKRIQRILERLKFNQNIIATNHPLAKYIIKFLPRIKKLIESYLVKQTQITTALSKK
jgi:hypothetical protein